MSETVFVVYSEGPDGQSFPYGVFSSEPPAEEAREALIDELDSQHDGHDTEDIAALLAGSLEDRISIRECELRDEFAGDDVEDFFEDA